ncbi:DUF6686 family protein [Winogradskyella sp. Asnod2-B02-A]|uniref:DUF6686 family protein n=1 Tax=Winogradskyella sp. Asnod2-B02-A TaxID=3160583 RepID=UPI00386D34BC
MCHNIKVLSKVSHGELSLCKECHIYHLEFNNIYFEFTKHQYHRFKNYLMEIEEDYWEEFYADARVKRKIPIPSIQENLVLMFNKQEILELKALFCNRGCVFENYISLEDLDYTLILN